MVSLLTTFLSLLLLLLQIVVALDGLQFKVSSGLGQPSGYGK
jgi:hypothetical protein